MRNRGITRKFLAMLLALTLCLTFTSSFTALADTGKTFDLVEITDFHGALESSSGQPAGAVLAKDIKAIRDANPDRFLMIGAGDLYQGTPVSNVLRGVPVQKALSNIGMEVTTLGNHEFDWDLNTVLNTTMKDSKYSIVCANIYNTTTNKRVFDPYKVFTKDGVKIAVIGAITTETPKIVLAANVAGFKFTDPAEEINACAKEIKDGKLADIILAVVHEGGSVAADGTTSGNLFTIAKSLTNVDALFGGHTHTIVNTTVNGMPVVVANNAGKGFIHMTMTVDSSMKPTFTSEYFAIDNDKATGYKAATPATDPEVAAIVADAKAELGPVFDEVLGTAATTLTRTQDVAPYGESFLGNWGCEAMQKKVKADVAIQNNGGLRIDVPKGNITVGTIFTLMPFDNTICNFNLTKAQLKGILEQGLNDADAANKLPAGMGVQFSGIKVIYDAARPNFDKITSITRADGTPISDTEVLKVATNNFLAGGGDGFTDFKKYPYTDTNILVRDAMMEDARANKGIVTTLNNRLDNVSKIAVIATSDLHGNVFPIDYATGKAANLGLLKVATYVNNLRKYNSNVMLVDSGDTIQGTPFSYYYDKIDTKTEYPMMQVMGAMKYDAWTLGNHEFNYGLGTLDRIVADAKKEGISVLSANTYKTADNTNYVLPYIIKSFNINGKTIKVGILGLTTKTIPSWENESNYSGLKFNDLVDEAKKWVPKVKEAGADVVIATIHSGEEKASDTIPENQIIAVAQGVSGIDVIAAGHAHSLIAADKFKNPDGKDVVVTEPKNNASYVTEIDINVNAAGAVSGITTRNIAMDASIPADTAIAAKVQPYEDATLAYINTVIGKSTAEYSGKDQTIKPTALMDLINTVQMKAAGTQLSIAAPLSASAYIPSGDIKIKDIMSVYVYENFLYGIKMNGEQIKKWLEYSVKYYQQVSGASDPIVKDAVLNVPDYNLDFLYGATYDVDLTQPVGSRIKNLKYDGKEIKDTDVFTVAINNYRFNGGGGFMAEAGLTPGDQSIVTYDSAKVLGDDGQVRSLMIDYVTKNKTITPAVANNWTLSTSAAAVVTPEPAGETVYIVKAGDWLKKIGQMFHINFMDIARRNNLKNPDLILIGQKLIIPAH